MKDNINFTARYVAPVKVKRIFGPFKPSTEVSFVELSKKDKIAIQQVAKSWNCDISDMIALNSS